MADPASGKDNPDRTDNRKIGAQLLRYAAKITIQGIKLGKSPAEIVSKLRQIGLTREEAASIEDLARLAYQHSQMRISTMLMVSGVLWAIAAIIVPILRPGPNARTYSWMILIVAALQWLYGWPRRRWARRLRPMGGDLDTGPGQS